MASGPASTGGPRGCQGGAGLTCKSRVCVFDWLQEEQRFLDFHVKPLEPDYYPVELVEQSDEELDIKEEPFEHIIFFHTLSGVWP